MKQTEKNYKRVSKKFYDWRAKAHKAAVDYLQDVLKETPRIIFDTEYDDEIISVSYDGGNHPEYASSMRSQVFAVYKDPKSQLICLEMEDCPTYEIDRLTTEDLLYVCEGVQAHLKNLEEK